LCLLLSLRHKPSAIHAARPSFPTRRSSDLTLHPNFRDYIPRLRDAAKFLSLTTNLQKVSEEILRCILNAPIDVVNISVDGGHKEAYERMRIGGKFERLLENLTRMRDLKHELHARSEEH